MRIKSFLFIAVMFQMSCVVEYTPEIEDYLNVLVVEGEITNEPGPYTVKLSKSSEVNKPKLIPVQGAEIIISDNSGNTETLSEAKPGLYLTDVLGMRGIVGRKYKIIIQYNGETYQSDFEELAEPVKIDSIYTKIEKKGRLEGLQFYINTKSHEKSKQLFWKLTETYKYEADDYPLAFIYHSPDNIEIADPDAIHVCWRTYNLFEIFTGTTENLSANALTDFQLHYVDNETKRLLIKYSLLINQYSISKELFEYWAEMKEQNDESGSLYSRQPYHVKSNIYNSNNPNEIVLGYFMVAGVSKKRIFVDRPQIKFNLDLCKATHDDYIRWTRRSPPTYPIYIKLVGGEKGKAGLGCFDCRMEGGTTQKPDFWID